MDECPSNMMSLQHCTHNKKLSPVIKHKTSIRDNDYGVVIATMLLQMRNAFTK